MTIVFSIGYLVWYPGFGSFEGKTLVIGGDGRFHNDVAIQTMLKMAAANAFTRSVSLPAMSSWKMAG